LNKGEEGRQTTRAMFDLLRCDFPHLSNLRVSDAIHMSDLKLILTLWRLQIEQAEQTLIQFANNTQLQSLYAEKLIVDPSPALVAINQALELGIPDQEIREIVESEKRLVDAKNPNQQFSTSKRAERYSELEAFYGADLENGYLWMLQNNPATRLVPSLSNSLKLS
jgi:hypothetical protein